MDNKSIYGLKREQLQRILYIGTGKGKFWDSASEDQTIDNILRERLDSSFDEERSCPGNKTLIQVLLDSGSDIIATKTVEKV